MHIAKAFLVFSGAGGALAGDIYRRATYHGVATFNNYAGQGNTVCGKAPVTGTHGAATGDWSPNISPKQGGKMHCDGKVELTLCNGMGGLKDLDSYKGPECPVYLPAKGQKMGPPGGCGRCFKVVNDGSADPNTPAKGKGNSVIVQIIDACPRFSALNYCKAQTERSKPPMKPTPSNQRCDVGTDALDIDFSAYPDLTDGRKKTDRDPNLKVLITAVNCP